MEFLYALEAIRHPVLNVLMSVITPLGSEMMFIAAAVIAYWCVDKRVGYYLMATGFIGTTLNQFLKILCRIPRPWVRDPGFTIVESARADAGGYSFPSGHTQSVTSVMGGIARASRRTWARIVCVLVILLVSFSRMYLGVHTPADVLFSLGLGAVLVFALWPLFAKSGEHPEYILYVFGASTALALVCAVFVWLYPWGPAVDADNLAESVKAINMILGCSAAVLIGAPLERKQIRFDPKAPWWAQILKVLLGLAIVMALRMALKPLLALIFGGLGIAHALRYFLLVLFVVLVWPRTFPWFAKGCPLKREGN